MASRIEDLRRRVDQLERRAALSPDLARLEEHGMTPDDLRAYQETYAPPDGLSEAQVVVLEDVAAEVRANVLLGAKLPPA